MAETSAHRPSTHDTKSTDIWINSKCSLIGAVFARKYKIVKKLGSGSFGEIFLAKDQVNGANVAIKLEERKTAHPQLAYEATIYTLLRGTHGVPNARMLGSAGPYNVMVMDLLGRNLEELFNICDRRFSVACVLMIADQLLTHLEHIHQKHFVHRDIKPENFLIGLPKKESTLYVIDFGLTKRYRHPATLVHIPYADGKSLVGTPRYASVATHLGIEQSRRDDLESLGYVLMYFLRGSLPWQGLRAATRKQKYKKILQKKMGTPLERLCHSLPPEFRLYFEYCRGLRFQDSPDYYYLRGIFRSLLSRMKHDGLFDWQKGPAVERLKEKYAKLLGSGSGGGSETRPRAGRRPR